MIEQFTFEPKSHTYRWKGKVVPSVTQILSGVGLYDFSFVNPGILKNACERGTVVHEIIELYSRGELDENSIDPQLVGYFEAYKSLNLPEPMMVEEMMYSEKFFYAGTIDQYYHNSWVNDIKTGSPDPAHGLQLTAYWLMLSGGNLLREPLRLTCSYLQADGRAELVDYKYEPLSWLSVLGDYRWRANNNKIKKIGEK